MKFILTLAIVCSVIGGGIAWQSLPSSDLLSIAMRSNHNTEKEQASDWKEKESERKEAKAKVEILFVKIATELDQSYQILEKRRYRQRHDLLFLKQQIQSSIIDFYTTRQVELIENYFNKYYRTFNEAGVDAVIKLMCEVHFSEIRKLLSQIKTLVAIVDASDSESVPLVSNEKEMTRLYEEEVARSAQLLNVSAAFSGVALFAFLLAFIIFNNRIKKEFRARLSKAERACATLDTIGKTLDHPLAVVSSKGRIVWANQVFKKVFSLSDKKLSAVSVAEIDQHLQFVKNEFNNELIVQIKDVLDSEFVLRKKSESKRKSVSIAFYPLVSFYREYLESRKIHALDMEIGSDVFVLQNLVDEILIETSLNKSVQASVVDGKLPILMHGSENHYAQSLKAVLHLASKFALKTAEKKMNLEMCKMGDRVQLIANIPSIHLDDHSLDESINGMTIARYLQKTEEDSLNLNASIALKNMHYEDGSKSINVELFMQRRCVEKHSGMIKQEETCV